MSNPPDTLDSDLTTKKKQPHPWRPSWIMFFGIVFTLLGYLFHVMHWPGQYVMIVSATGTMAGSYGVRLAFRKAGIPVLIYMGAIIALNIFVMFGLWELNKHAVNLMLTWTGIAAGIDLFSLWFVKGLKK